MIKHIVMWKVKEGETVDNVVTKFRAMLDDLAKVCPVIVEGRVGINLNESEVFDFCIDSVFNNAEDLNTYIYHPVHLKIREYLTSISCEKAVFDYKY